MGRVIQTFGQVSSVSNLEESMLDRSELSFKTHFLPEVEALKILGHFFERGLDEFWQLANSEEEGLKNEFSGHR